MKKIQKTIISFFCKNWQLKLLSLLLSILIWFMICEYVDPDTSKMIMDIPVAVDYEGSVPESESLAIMTTVDKTVNVRVSGSRDAIALMNPSAVSASLDLRNVTYSGEYDLPVVIDLGNSNLKLETQSVKTIKVKFDKKVTTPVKINVNVDGDVAEGFVLKEPKLLNTHIAATGPKEIIDTIASAEVYIEDDLFTETTENEYEFEFVGKDGDVIESPFIITDIEVVRVKLQVLRQKEVPFDVTLINSSGGNVSSLCSVEFSPASITLIGGADALADYNTHFLGEIDLAEVTENQYKTSFTVKLQSNDIENADNVTDVKVTVKFNETVTTAKRNVKNISLENVPEGTTITIPKDIKDKGLDITVRGLPDAIDALDTKSIKLVVDAGKKTLANGQNRLGVRVEFPEGANVSAVGKYELSANVKVKK